MLIDTHCHLDHALFDEDRDAILQRSREAGVGGWVVPGVRVDDLPRMAALTGPGIHLAPGLHPLFALEHPPDALQQLEAWLKGHHAVAIGEIGLDAMAPPESRPAQEDLFRSQLERARIWGLPVLLHVRRAHDEALAILRRHPLPRGGIVHAFSGSAEQAKRYIDLGFRTAFGGSLTRPRAERVRRIATTLPLELLVLETDAPFLPPFGFDGQRNEPAHLLLVARELARLREKPLENIIAVTGNTARSLLGLTDEA
ncbi:MAG: TatD family hydrolase [Magnetococcales bacterium]|nr:TatD family hydrolase [Magnetococcales bacterium]